MISVDFYRLGKSQSMILTNINLPSALGATQLKICILQHKMYFYCTCIRDPFFSKVEKKNSWLPLNQSQMMST